MQTDAEELVSKLRGAIKAIGNHLSQIDCIHLQALEATIPHKAPAESAEMVTLLLIYRKMENPTGRMENRKQTRPS
ncbi:hypothetical protein [Mesorhizobium sp. WSM3859]|uniref:hypothetical protein n=1 Tax=Mesorhizobium sp. WSM3859 TaxID=2029402 RepID=UPI000BAFF1A6|nr:hypothetical protein [Mesorhizobium sp. WSM3859]PBC09379.1 hypothetical protein CK230_14615 [Mesorhizobium sp. WSM3859]